MENSLYGRGCHNRTREMTDGLGWAPVEAVGGNPKLDPTQGPGNLKTEPNRTKPTNQSNHQGSALEYVSCFTNEK